MSRHGVPGRHCNEPGGSGYGQTGAAIPSSGDPIARQIALTIGNGRQFRDRCEFATWSVRVPKNRSSGGKERLDRSGMCRSRSGTSVREA
ncbi:MAG: transposase [Pseudomonadota bacterium]